MASKLDPYASDLIAWKAQGQTFKQIVQSLADKHGVSTSTGALSAFFKSQADTDNAPPFPVTSEVSCDSKEEKITVTSLPPDPHLEKVIAELLHRMENMQITVDTIVEYLNKPEEKDKYYDYNYVKRQVGRIWRNAIIFAIFISSILHLIIYLLINLNNK